MKILLWLGLFCALAGQAAAAVVTYGPTRYLQASDSPWYQGIQNGTIYLEDFKDGLLNTPFVSSNGQIRGPGDKRSVDADDGVLDGEGQVGGTWGIADGFDMEFNFSPNVDGLYPSFVGIVVTKSARALEMLSIYDTNGARVNIIQYDLTAVHAKSNDNFLYDVTEARFIGVHLEAGISRVSLLRAMMADHLQYGYAIPEPASALSVLAGLCTALYRRRRR
jgi:hypothetical protein